MKFFRGLSVIQKGATETKTVTADGNGAFSFAINRASGGPYDLTIGGAAGNVTAHDVLIGDVFICSGQAC